MSNKFVDIFSSDISSNESNEKQSDFFPSENTYQEKEETQKSFNEQRYINKLSLRKKKNKRYNLFQAPFGNEHGKHN